MNGTEETVARARLLDVPFHVDRTYDYYIPPQLQGKVVAGSIVCVPFGGGNRKQLAVISELACVTEVAEPKPVLSLACESITLTGEQRELIAYLRTYTLCTTGDAVRAILPPSVLTRLTDYYVTASDPDRNTELKSYRQQVVYAYVSSFEKVTLNQARDFLGEWAPDTMKDMEHRGYLKRITKFSEPLSHKTAESVSLAVSPEQAMEAAESMRTAPRQADLLRTLVRDGVQSAAELREIGKFTTAQMKNLQQQGLIRIQKHPVYRDPYAKLTGQIQRPAAPLSQAQERVRAEISQIIAAGKPCGVLLRGVTGSGKTRVIQALMDEVIAMGKGVILLVPEIGLTPQAVAIFRACYGDRAVVMHSQLSAGERYDAWERIREGKADLCIGTRSAIFAPFEKIGLIVMDEEQESTYKSDSSPKYHARDIARFRCAKHNAVLLMASATPSLETEYRALEGRYREVILGERYGNAVLPECVIADLRQDPEAGISPIGTRLREELAQVLARKEQAILFVNRRGYNNFLSCPVCGTVLMCPHCSVSYTYHTAGYGMGVENGYLLCHYCGAREPVPAACPSCGNTKWKRVGYGTQRVEEELQKLFPDARILRMDADTTVTKFAYDEILSSFREKKADILIGTQMVTKGHDFPGVTLVGVLNADGSLYVDDYRALERTFTLITQVVGRAGRGELPGRALIQTVNPDHPVLKLAAAQDYMTFYQNEIALRRSLVFPPCCDLLLLSLTSPEEAELSAAAEQLGQMLTALREGDFQDVGLILFGPIEAPLYKINETYKKNFIIKCRFNARTREMIYTLIGQFDRKLGKRVILSVDLNPNSL